MCFERIVEIKRGNAEEETIYAGYLSPLSISLALYLLLCSYLYIYLCIFQSLYSLYLSISISIFISLSLDLSQPNQCEAKVSWGRLGVEGDAVDVN